MSASINPRNRAKCPYVRNSERFLSATVGVRIGEVSASQELTVFLLSKLSLRARFTVTASQKDKIQHVINI